MIGPSRKDPEYFSASLGNSVLGQFGMMGRIGEVVREKSGLAYYASSSLNAGTGPGSWEVSAGVNPKNLKKAIDLILRGRGLRQPGPATEWVKLAIAVVRDNRDFVLCCAWVESDVERWLTLHTMRSTLLALLFGDFLKTPPHRLIELGNACLLHEIGMLKLPVELRRTAKKLSDDERKAIITHTVVGYRVLKGISGPGEHRTRGPRAPRAHGRLGVPARALQRPDHGVRPDHRRRLLVRGHGVATALPRGFDLHTAIRELLQKDRKQYDDRVLKALVYTLSFFPIGTNVLLSNGGKGVVVRTDPARPRCPVVRVLTDPGENGPRRHSSA